jgi:hypothetical protein
VSAGTPTIDGSTNDGVYGATVAVQTNQTGFGDSTGGTPNSTAGGGELDNMRITDDANNLYVAVAGNFEHNGNFCAIWIDCDNNSATGASTIPAGGFGYAAGSKLPIGAELCVTPNAGNTYDIFCNAHLYTGASPGTFVSSDFLGSVPYSGTPTVVTSGTITHTINGTTRTITLAINNSNTSGVLGGNAAITGAENPGAINTGLEIGIPKTLLVQAKGSAGISTIKLYAAYTSGSGFFSNQMLPGLLVPAANVGNTPDLSGQNKITYTMTTAQAAVDDWAMY